MNTTVDPNCRFCAQPLTHTFADLGHTPLANSYLSQDDLGRPEPSYPLHARVCSSCFLVQLPEVASPEEIFGRYAYYSSYSTSWLEHSKRFAEDAIERLGLSNDSLVLEVASNDGYLLQFFKEAGVPVLGVEPARNIAAEANAAGIPTEAEFFGASFAKALSARGVSPDLVVGNNVLAHVPDINDFVAGLSTILAPGGTLVMEFPHLLNLIDQVQFDTIYHEHFSYLSLLSVERIFGAHDLSVCDVERIDTHGGSLRVFARAAGEAEAAPSAAVLDLRRVEAAAGLADLATYAAFADRVESARQSLRAFLDECRREGKRVAAYGAAAKGNTLLNTVGATADDIEFVVDRNPHKQGLYLPGSHIPIHEPEKVAAAEPDYLLILPWNLTGEIVSQMAEIRSWGGRFVVAIPETRVLP